MSILHHLKLCNGTSLVRETWTDFTALLIHINLERGKKKAGEKGFSHLSSLAITHFTWIEQYSEQSFLISKYANYSIWHFPLSRISQRCSFKLFSLGAKTVKSFYFWYKKKTKENKNKMFNLVLCPNGSKIIMILHRHC